MASLKSTVTEESKKYRRGMYTQDITRRHRAAIVIAIDQSCSMGMQVNLGGLSLTKSELVSIVTGQLIDELIMRSHRDNTYRHYYDIAIVGYSGNSVYPLIGEELAFYPITTLATSKVRRKQYTFTQRTLSRGLNLVCEYISIWVEPRNEGDTPMYKMINCVTELVEEWCNKEENVDSFPPLVFNITDGEASDADYDMLRGAAARLKATGTRDGNTLFINCHLSTNTLHASVLFPNLREVPISIRQAYLMMDMSSLMPEQFNAYILECRATFSEPPYVAMSYNASIAELVAMLNIGTRSLVMGL